MLERRTLRSRRPTGIVVVIGWFEPTIGDHARRGSEREVGGPAMPSRLGRRRTDAALEVLGVVGIDVRAPDHSSGEMNPFEGRRHPGAGGMSNGTIRDQDVGRLGRLGRDRCERGAEGLADERPVEPRLRGDPWRGGRVKWSRVGLREQGLGGLGYRNVDPLVGLRKGGRAGLDVGEWTSKRGGWGRVCG